MNWDFIISAMQPLLPEIPWFFLQSKIANASKLKWIKESTDQEGLVSQTESYSRERWLRYPSMSWTTPSSSKNEFSSSNFGPLLLLLPPLLLLLRQGLLRVILGGRLREWKSWELGKDGGRKGRVCCHCHEQTLWGWANISLNWDIPHIVLIFGYLYIHSLSPEYICLSGWTKFNRIIYLFILPELIKYSFLPSNFLNYLI